MSTLPAIFIGSSTEGLPIARAISADLLRRGGSRVQLWDEGVFRLSESVPDGLTRAAAEYDFAVFVFSPDDIVISRQTEIPGPRDNVVFELGLFAGHLGRERTFVVVLESGKVKLPSDFAGVTHANYFVQRDDQCHDLVSVSAACDQIMEAVSRLGRLRHPTLESTLYSIVQNYRQAFRVDHDVFQSHLKRWAKGTKDESEAWGQGLLRIRIHYGQFLADIYKRAEQSVFSTTVPTYNSEVWKGALKSFNLGRVLLKAQQANVKARSTRIFIYADEQAITDDDIRIMKMHQEYRIEVYVYVDSVYPGFEYPPDNVESDWTMIDDGKAIGITKTIDSRRNEAYWYFNNQGKAKEYKELRDSLLELAVPLDDWLLSQKALNPTGS